MLEAKDTRVGAERSARQDPLTDDDVREMLTRVDRVIVARGKKTVTHEAAVVDPDQLKGPTGNYRAPMVRAGKVLLVGFHPDTLEELTG